MTRRPRTDGGGDSSRPKSARDAYDIGADERPSEAVVRAVSTFLDTPPLDLDPLYDAIDPAHLDGLFDGDGSFRTATSIAFSYEGYEVTVTGDAVSLREADEVAR